MGSNFSHVSRRFTDTDVPDAVHNAVPAVVDADELARRKAVSDCKLYPLFQP
jgi:hypothetical protein